MRLIANVDSGILLAGLAVLLLALAFSARGRGGKAAPDVPVTTFEGTRVLEDGVIAVLFHARWCPFSRVFGEAFEAWDPPAGVVRRIGDLTPHASPLWDAFDLHTTPTLALFKDGELVWRRDGVRRQGLGKADLAALDAEARRLVADG